MIFFIYNYNFKFHSCDHISQSWFYIFIYEFVSIVTISSTVSLWDFVSSIVT